MVSFSHRLRTFGVFTQPAVEQKIAVKIFPGRGNLRQTGQVIVRGVPEQISPFEECLSS
jgi:hypothetical protein